MQDLFGRDTAPWEEEPPEVDPNDFTQEELDQVENNLDRMRQGKAPLPVGTRK